MLKNKGFLTIFYHFFSVLLYLYPILYTHMKRKNTMKKNKTKKSSKDDIMKKNVEYMVGSEDNAISDVDYATCEALAQDGESIEEYAI